MCTLHPDLPVPYECRVLLSAHPPPRKFCAARDRRPAHKPAQRHTAQRHTVIPVVIRDNLSHPTWYPYKCVLRILVIDDAYTSFRFAWPSKNLIGSDDILLTMKLLYKKNTQK